jgi:hypothetical protein
VGVVVVGVVVVAQEVFYVSQELCMSELRKSESICIYFNDSVLSTLLLHMSDHNFNLKYEYNDSRYLVPFLEKIIFLALMPLINTKHSNFKVCY